MGSVNRPEVDQIIVLTGLAFLVVGFATSWIAQEPSSVGVTRDALAISLAWGWESYQVQEIIALLPAAGIVLTLVDRYRSRTTALATSMSGVLYLLLPIYVVGEWKTLLGPSGDAFVFAPGAYVTSLGGVALLVGGMVQLLKQRNKAPRSDFSEEPDQT